MGISDKQVSLMETGKRPCSLEYFYKACDAFGICPSMAIRDVEVKIAKSNNERKRKRRIAAPVTTVKAQNVQ